MFKKRLTKIVSSPVEEVLEVTVQEPIIKTVYNIDYITVNDDSEEASHGFLIDSNEQKYEFNWDKKLNRISSLSGENIDPLTWNLCEKVLNKYYIKTKEEPVELKIAEALKIALAPINSNIKNVEEKIEKSLNVRQRTAVQAPVQSAPRPQTVQSVPSMPADTPAVSVADDDISANALRFLQQSPNDDLGVDYLSL